MTKMIIKNGMKYREIATDLELELAISSKSIALLSNKHDIYPIQFFPAIKLNDEAINMCLKSTNNYWIPFICIGPTEEADTNSSDFYKEY